MCCIVMKLFCGWFKNQYGIKIKYLAVGNSNIEGLVVDSLVRMWKKFLLARIGETVMREKRREKHEVKKVTEALKGILCL